MQSNPSAIVLGNFLFLFLSLGVLNFTFWTSQNNCLFRVPRAADSLLPSVSSKSQKKNESRNGLILFVFICFVKRFISHQPKRLEGDFSLVMFISHQPKRLEGDFSLVMLNPERQTGEVVTVNLVQVFLGETQ